MWRCWKVLFGLLIVALSSQAGAWTHGSPLVPGRAQQGVGATDLTPAAVINQFNALGTTLQNPADAGILDAQGFPTQAPQSNILINGAAPVFTSTTYVMVWSGTRQLPVLFGNSITGCANVVGATVTGCSGFTTTVQQTAGSGSLTFTLQPGTWNIQFPTTGTYVAGAGTLAIYRLSDLARYQAGKLFTPEFEAQLSALRPRYIRTMGWVNSGNANFTNQCKWKYRQTTSDLTWGPKYPPGAWSGNITGTDQFVAAPAPDTPLSGWQNCEVLIGYTSNAATQISISNITSNGGLCRLTVNSTAAITNGQTVWPAGFNGATCGGNPLSTYTATVINGTTLDLVGSTFGGSYTSGGKVGIATLSVTGKSGGAKFIADAYLYPPYQNTSYPAGLVSCLYNSLSDRAVCVPGTGIQSLVPFEAQVQFANDIGSGLWAVIPFFAEDDYVSNEAAVLLALNPTNPALFEYSNEVWNSGFPQTTAARQLGNALGWSDSSGQNTFGWYALRVRQIMGNLIPVVWAGRTSQLRRGLMYQAGGDTTQLTRMTGSMLNPNSFPLLCAYLGFTYTGGACPGSTDYSAFSNRPADVVETIGGAPYASGANLCLQGLDAPCGTSDVNTAWLQSLIDTWNSGNTAAAIAMVDVDVRNNDTGSWTVTGSGTTFTTGTNHTLVIGSKVWITVTGGTASSGVTPVTALYRVTGATSNTFTMQPYTNGQSGGSNINAGTAGSGTMTVHRGSTAYNFQMLAGTWWAFGEWLAAQFDASRPPGMSALRYEWYEGALEVTAPSDAQAVTLGLTNNGVACANPGTCSALVFTIIQAWRNDPVGTSTMQAYYNYGLGLDPSFTPTYGLLPHFKTPANLALPGPAANPGNPYALIGGAFPNSTPYQTFYGFQAYSAALPALP